MESAAEGYGRRRTVTKRVITTLSSCARHLVTQFWWSTLLQQVPQNWQLLTPAAPYASVGHPMRRCVSVFDTSRREQRKTALATASWMRSRATLSRFGQPSHTGEAYSRAGRTRPTNRRLTIAAEFRRWASRLSTKAWKLCFRIRDWTWSVHFRLDVSTTPVKMHCLVGKQWRMYRDRYSEQRKTTTWVGWQVLTNAAARRLDVYQAVAVCAHPVIGR